jgi:hypothetical protein
MTAAPSWERGSWMQTFTGRQFYPLAPRPEDIEPADIGHALAMICRYGGHTTRFYSVAEHCVLMSHRVPTEDALWALLHDAAEAYVGDMVRPLKHHMPAYRAVEERVLDAIAERFGYVYNGLSANVKEADNRILLDERAALLAPAPAPWGVEDMKPLGVAIEGWSPAHAEARYLARLEELTQ